MLKILIKNFKYIFFVFLIFGFSLNIIAQTTNQYKTFITKGEVNYYLTNFQNPFPLIDNSIIPQNCKIVTGKNGYLEIHSNSDLIRILPSSTLEVNNNNFKLISGTIYINTINQISITIDKNNLTIYKGIVIVQNIKIVLINFLNDAQVELNAQIYKPSKNERIFTITEEKLQPSKEKLPLSQFNIFNKEITNKIVNVNDLVDIFFERIYYLIEKNNSFIQIIDNSEKKGVEIENTLKNQIIEVQKSNSNTIALLNRYGEIYQTIESQIMEYNFNKYHYLEFYFQMRNYFEYYKRLIEYANNIYDLSNFEEFPDYSSKSSFMIVYDKIKSFTETVRLSYQLLEITYINILDSNSPINKSFNKYNNLKQQLQKEIENLIKQRFSNMPKDINSTITQTFMTQLYCKTSTTIYINKLYDILMILNNEYIEDEKIINKFFSLDDIIYKSLYLEQAKSIKTELIDNFSTLDRNIVILKYLSSNSNLAMDNDTQNFLNIIIQFYPTYNDDYLSLISIIDEINKSYNKYYQLLKFFLKKDELNYYQNIFSREIDKYLEFISYLQGEILKIKQNENIDVSFLNSLLDIQEKLINVTYSLYEVLKLKYPSIQFPKKLYIDQQKEYLIKLKDEIKNLNIEKINLNKNEEMKKFLIIRIVVINQILEDIEIFKQSIKDYEFQKSNVQKSLLLYNLALTNKTSFNAQNFTDNTSIIWEANQIFMDIDDFYLKLNIFEKNLSRFFEDIQNYYLLESFSEQDYNEIEKKVILIKKQYNDFTITYFELIDKIFKFSTNLTQIQANNEDIKINDIINEFITFFFLFKSKFDSFRYILSVLRVIFSIG